jgi:hypothetical protein
VPDLNTLLDQHVTLVYESVDRIFLNGYVAKLQEPDQLAWFLCQHRGEEIPRYELLGKMTREFVAAIEQMAQDRHIPVVHFEKGQRKETIAEPYFTQAALLGREGVVLVGVAQEKANVFGPQHIQRYFDRWMYRLPSPFTAHDCRAGYTYQLSILQLEVARTEVFDRPLHGRQFSEEVIRQHLDLGDLTILAGA